MMDTHGACAPDFPEAPPGLGREQTGRLLAAVALAILTLSFRLILLSGPTHPGWVALAGLLVFSTGLVMSLLVLGGRAPTRHLIVAGVMTGVAGLVLHAIGEVEQSAIRQLFSVTLALTAAVCWGVWVARGVRTAADLLTVILCAAVGDAWFTVLGVTEGLEWTHPVAWLRMTGLVEGQGRLSPFFTDVFFGALFLEAGRRLGVRVSLQVFGALAGFAGAQVVSLTTWQSMPVLPLVGLGVLVGAWPDLRCTLHEVLKGVAVAVLLFALLLGSVFVRRALYPVPQRKPEFFLPHDVASQVHVLPGARAAVDLNCENDVDGIEQCGKFPVPSGIESFTSRA